MPKSQFLDPAVLRKSGTLSFPDIPLNQYQKTLKDVKKEFKKAELQNIYKDMQTIREFETMLTGVRTVKTYNGVNYQYTGPAHLYIGQESAAVGQAFALEVDDFTFGNHRSHGEMLARSFQAIRQLDDETLYRTLKEYKDGKLLAQVEKFSKADNTKDLALDFVLYGFMSELFGREIGFTGGLGNSMHVFFKPFGIYPQNAIVGGASGLGAGAALYKRVNHKPGIVVVNSGDGSLSTGCVWECINFATMKQLTELWEDEYKGGLPVIFNFMNNGYAMSGQTATETMGYEILARVGAAFNEDMMHSERIDGLNPFAVIDAFRRKKQLVLENKGPVFLDTLTYRHTGHSVTDQNAYRTKDEMDVWMENDCIARYKKEMISERVMTKKETEQFEADIKEKITNILRYATDLEFTPRMDLQKDPDAIARCMFSNEHILKMDDREPEVIGEKKDNSRMVKIMRKSRFGLDENGKELSPMKTYTLRDAVFEPLLDKFYEDPTMVLYGEDIREHGNSFGVLQGLYESVPYHRMFNAPIAESSIVLTAVGYAMCGGRAVPEIMWGDFIGRCADELFNQLAKWQGMSAGNLKMPVVCRISVGAFYGAQHSQDWTSWGTHVPGIKIVYPATPYDMKGLMNSALSGSDPVLMFESQKLYDKGELFHKEGVPEGYYEIPIGEPDIKREGSDITILTIGPTLYPAMKAADILQEKYGMSAEIIDARTLVPFNYEPVIESVKKTGRNVLVSDACERGSYIKTMAENITELAFNYLDAPPATVGSHNWVSPCPELERYYFPNEDTILDTIHEKIKRLEGYEPTTDVSINEKLRRELLGI